MAKIDVLDLNGKKTESIEISDSIFNIEANKQVLFDAVMLQRANLRQGTHSVKNRSAVSGGGRKPWRQKGTGRARQGTIRAPQWRGGGVVFGPTPRKYTLKMNKKVRKLALKSALSLKFQAGNLIVVDNFNLESNKTKDFVKVMENLKIERKGLFVDKEFNENLYLANRNIVNTKDIEATGINVLDIMNANKMIVSKDALSKIEEVLG